MVAMKNSTFEKGNPMLPRLALCLPVLLAALALMGGCYSEGREGDRCDPNRTSDECGGGLVCSGYSNVAGDPGQNWLSANYPIASCPEDYCCPPDLSRATSPYCQPGCNGGAAAICATSPTTQDAACALANGTPLPSDDAAAEGAPPEGAATEAGE